MSFTATLLKELHIAHAQSDKSYNVIADLCFGTVMFCQMLQCMPTEATVNLVQRTRHFHSHKDSTLKLSERGRDADRGCVPIKKAVACSALLALKPLAALACTLLTSS